MNNAIAVTALEMAIINPILKSHGCGFFPTERNIQLSGLGAMIVASRDIYHFKDLLTGLVKGFTLYKTGGNR